jgi:FkbM family methyltransferase
MKNIVTPSNKSWTYFKNSWKPCVFGGINYLLKHPIKGPATIYKRLRYPIFKKSVSSPYTTPEGFLISTNQEQLIHAQIFIEQNLFNKQFINEFKKTSNASIIDVGANHGMVTAWLGSLNDTATFWCIEPFKEFADIGRSNTSHLQTIWLDAAVSDADGFIPLYLGGLVSCAKPSLVKEERKVKSLTLDGFIFNPFLVKIDTDGHSNEVINGAKDILKRTRWVIIEEEDGLDLSIFNGWQRWKLPSGCDWLLLNPNTKPYIH